MTLTLGLGYSSQIFLAGMRLNIVKRRRQMDLYNNYNGENINENNTVGLADGWILDEAWYLFGEGVLAASVCLSSCISCLWDRQMADSFSNFKVISAFSEFTCFSCSLSLSISASNASSFPSLSLLTLGLSLLLSNSATKVLEASSWNKWVTSSSWTSLKQFNLILKCLVLPQKIGLFAIKITAGLST